MLRLEKFSIGVGDRFAHQAQAQLRACTLAAERGITVIPVWNKSNREHSIIGSQPSSVRAAADAAVRELNWNGPYHVDADHINLDSVDRFLPSSDFFTIDVAHFIPATVDDFVDEHPELIGTIRIPGIARPMMMTPESVAAIASKYLVGIAEAGRIYRFIESKKGRANFITEVSMDETDLPQTPPELLVILAAIADEEIPIQTIAPKFTGRFNKGVDYVGDVRQFTCEFENDVAVIAHAVGHYGLPATLKLSVHSGSDKFSIYPAIRRALRRTGAGLHLKTAGTTWLEELIGLALAGGLRRSRGAVRALRQRDRYRSGPAAFPVRSAELDFRTIHSGAAPRTHRPRFQSARPPASARRIQGRGQTWRSLPRYAQGVPGAHRAQRHVQSFRAPY